MIIKKKLKFNYSLPIKQIPELEVPAKPLIEMLSNEDETDNILQNITSKILPKDEESSFLQQKTDVFKNFDKIESEFDTLD